MDLLAQSVTTEQGKTLLDARGDVFRALEVVEATCNVGSALMGETTENLARGLDTYSYNQPLGVTAGIW
jgi:malonate-semialdehyde dehydrogenase (acetylating)/methylmalonate-semialdehyde dehydrogenase